MAISKVDGTKLFIHATIAGDVVTPVAVVPDTIEAMTVQDAIAHFEAITDWVEVGEVEQIGALGDQAQNVPFLSLGRQRVRKLKGSRDAGDQTIVVGIDPLDDGQEAVEIAETTNFNYEFKLEHPDAPSPAYTDSVTYYIGLVSGKPQQNGGGNTVRRRNFGIGVQLVYEVKAALAPT